MVSFSLFENVKSLNTTTELPKSAHSEANQTYSGVIFRLNKYFILQQVAYFTIFTAYMFTILRKYGLSTFSAGSKLLMFSLFSSLLIKLCLFTIVYFVMGHDEINERSSNIYRAVVLAAYPIDDYLFVIFGYVTYQMAHVFNIFKVGNEYLLKIRA